MQLSWQEQMAIAAALLKAYPEEDRLSLSPENLRQMIVSLPGFSDASLPPKESYLESILWQWMRLSHAGVA